MSEMNLKNKWIKKDMQVTELTGMISQLELSNKSINSTKASSI